MIVVLGGETKTALSSLANSRKTNPKQRMSESNPVEKTKVEKPSRLEALAESAKGMVKEAVGTLTGSEETRLKGESERLEAASKNEQAKRVQSEEGMKER